MSLTRSGTVCPKEFRAGPDGERSKSGLPLPVRKAVGADTMFIVEDPALTAIVLWFVSAERVLFRPAQRFGLGLM
jgi:hypothetical protein